ncbi:hypothetical protein GmHk_10G028897 [Glycine max]|nr:hypothetical protein GmHk_10G028897 [Glycine max]
MQSQGLALPSKPEVGPLAARVSTKGSCVDPSRNDPETGDSNKCRLYIEENSSHLVALGRVYEGSTAVHNIPLLHGQVKVGVEEVKDAEAPVLVPTNEVQLVGQALNTFLAWLTHLVKHVLEQVMWDATVFGVFNQDFPLYIKHEDLSKISHGGQCLSISVIQLWILHLTKTSMRAGNSDVNGFLEPQSIQRSGQSQFESESYIKSWMQSSKHDIYLGAYLNGPVVHVDPATGKADGPHRKKLRTYLGIVARDKVEITYENWKEVPTAQKDLIWEDIQAEFDIPEASDSRTKRKPWGRDEGSLNQTSRGNGPLQPIRTVSRTLYVTNTASARKSGPSFARPAETLLGRMCASWHRSSRSRILPPTFCLVGKLLAEKTKKKLHNQEALMASSTLHRWSDAT